VIILGPPYAGPKGAYPSTGIDKEKEKKDPNYGKSATGENLLE
jgi:hypothetical protein